MHYLIPLFLLLLLGGAPLRGQDILAGYVAEGLAQNLALQRQDLAQDQAQAALQAARSLYMPRVSLLASYMLAGGGRTLAFPVGDLLNPVYATLNQLTETQQFPTNIENVNEQFLPNNFHETKIRVIQPIFNPDIHYGYQAQQALTAGQAAAREAYRRELVRDIHLAYYGYLQAEAALRVYAETQELLAEVLRVNQRLVAQDKATPEVIYQAEYALSQLAGEVAMAEQERQSARAYVNFLLNRPLEQPVQVDSGLFRPAVPATALSTLQGDAWDQRPELDQLARAQQAGVAQVRLYQARALPRVNAVLDAGFQGFGYDWGNQGYWLAQVSLEWDLFQGGRRRAQQAQAQAAASSLDRQQAELRQQVALQVEQAWYGLEAAQRRREAAAAGLRSARQDLYLVQKQYQQDQTSLLELMGAQNRYTQARLQANLATYGLLMRQAELAFAAGQ